MPGFHPHCDCSLEPGSQDTRNLLLLFSCDPWIDRLNVVTFTRWWINAFCLYVRVITTLTEAFQELQLERSFYKA
jgi:hypothetical protein